MTTPTERTRALLETRTLLEALAFARAPGMSLELKADAKHLLRHYSPAIDVLTLADACPSVLSRPSRPGPECGA